MITTPILYEVPLLMDKAGVGDFLIERLGLTARSQPDWTDWEHMVQEVRRDKPTVRVALVGKYIELQDAYMSVREALLHSALSLGIEVIIDWVHSAELEKGRSWEIVRAADGIIVPGGFGGRGIEGKIQAARYARENKIPYLGLCLGMQLMVIEFTRHVLGDEEVNSTEFDRGTNHPVIDLMPDQRDIADMGGTMRLGLYPCELQPGTIAKGAYQEDVIDERHRHRFEFNNAYRDLLQNAGMRFSGISPDGRLIEIAELVDHPFMLGTHFHPEFLSRPNRPHPLFMAFLEAVVEQMSVSKPIEVDTSTINTT
jgi:CTP synthase